MFIFAMLLEVRMVPPGKPLFIPPSSCPGSMQLWDNTGDGTIDEVRFILEEECNLKQEEILRNRRGTTKTMYHDL
jgi:hypothetical protein